MLIRESGLITRDEFIEHIKMLRTEVGDLNFWTLNVALRMKILLFGKIFFTIQKITSVSLLPILMLLKKPDYGEQ